MALTKRAGQSRLFNTVSVYGLEFAVAMITLIISVSVLSFATFALFGYVADNNVSTGRGYFALWSSASTIVWVPVALLFYLRARAYMARHPEVTSQPAQRVFTIIYDIVMILTILSFSVAAVFAALSSLVKPEDTAEIVVGVAIPSAISALLFGGALVSFFKRPVVRRRTYAILFATAAAVIVVPTIIVSIVTLRSFTVDEYKEADLYTVKSAIDDYERDNDMIPSRLSDISSLVEDSATKGRLSDYTYKRIDGSRYELCTEFAAKSRYGYTSASDDYTYRSYGGFSQHPEGLHCFKLRVSSVSLQDRIIE